MSETYAPPGRDDATQPPRFSRPTLIFLIVVPLAWAVLLLFHPGGDGTTIYLDLKDSVTAWMVVHIGMMLFIPSSAISAFTRASAPLG